MVAQDFRVVAQDFRAVALMGSELKEFGQQQLHYKIQMQFEVGVLGCGRRFKSWWPERPRCNIQRYVDTEMLGWWLRIPELCARKVLVYKYRIRISEVVAQATPT